MYHREEFLVT